MPHVLVAGKIHAAGIEVLKAASGISFEVVESTANDAYLPRLPEADALVLRTQPLRPEHHPAAPRLKIVSRHGVGYDAVDVPALSARKIPLTIVGDVNSRAVAEHTMMLMLAAARRTVAFDGFVRNRNWNERNTFNAWELDGKSLLVLGFGRIGKRVAELAKAFGMDVSAFDPFVTADAMASLGIAAVNDMKAGLAAADYVTLHLPASPKGAVIGAAELSVMKPTAILVNAARGELIDEMALDAALRDGRLRHAALDVLRQEPPPPDHPLLRNPRTTISPHNAGLTEECAARMGRVAAQNIVDFFSGKLNPQLVVNREAIGL